MRFASLAGLFALFLYRPHGFWRSHAVSHHEPNGDEGIRANTGIIAFMQTEPDADIAITNHDRGIPEETDIQKAAASVSSPREYDVRLVDRAEIRGFMDTWHYSHTINGLHASYCFGMYYRDAMIGAMIYGGMAMRGQSVKYWDDRVREAYDDGLIGYNDADRTVIELRRLACIDDTVRNAESYFIGRTLRWLKRNATATGIRTVISYADERFRHHGTIYQAANFTHVGMTPAGRVIILDEPSAEDVKAGDGIVRRFYHDHILRVRDDGGKLKPVAIRLRRALVEGRAHYERTTGKHVYEYRLVKPDAGLVGIVRNDDLFSLVGIDGD